MRKHTLKTLTTRLKYLTVLITFAGWSTVSVANDKFEDRWKNLFLRYGPALQGPYINVAYPDAAVKYWGAAFTVPDGAKLKLEGQFPHILLYMSFVAMMTSGRTSTIFLPDYMMQNPTSLAWTLSEGSQRDGMLRSYKINILGAPAKTDYTAGQIRDGCKWKLNFPCAKIFS